MDISPLHERIHSVVGHVTYRSLGDATGQHPETVRRYMQGQSPSVEFLAALCARYDISAQWLLTGQGAMKQSAARAQALKEANPAELLSAVAAALEKLTLRVDRIEVFIQLIESRLRARAGEANSHQSPDHAPTREDKSARASAAAQAAAADPAAKARRVAGALPQRPRPDAG